MTSGEMRKAEELASEWLVDKKVVRFNLDQNEICNTQPVAQPDTSLAQPRPLLSQKTTSSN